MSVNRPTNVKQKDEDINQKLQLYGIFTAFANGKVPSNKQIDVALNSFVASKSLASPSAKLSPEGRHLLGDLRNVIEQAKVLLLTKNQGNLLQDFIWHCEQISGAGAQTPGAPVDKATAQAHGNQAVDGLRTLGTLIISNGEFRKLLSDATILIRDMAGDAAQSAANRVNPSEDQLNQIDRPADDNTWHDAPNLSKDNLKNQVKSQYNKQKPFDKNDLRDAAGDATQSAHPTGSRDPNDTANLAARDQQQGGASGVDGYAGANTGVNSLKDKASANVPDETKDRARNAMGQTKDYMSNKMPKERREQMIWRLKKMVVEIQSHQDYQQAIETLLSLAETYQGHAQNVSQQTAGTVKGAHDDDHLSIAEADLRTLIERFANSTSADDLFDSINAIYRDADNDPELKGWFRHITAYVRKCLKTEGYVMQDDATKEWNQLYEQGEFLIRDRYKDHTHRIVDELKFMAEQFDADPTNKQFANSMQKLFNDLGNDQNGKPTFKAHLVKDLTNVILPDIFEGVRYVPIPRIEYSDPMMDAIVENLVIESDNLMPNVFEFGSDNYFRFGRKQVASKASNKTMLSVSGVQMDLKDVSYYVKKKSGFPKVTDLGVADIYMGGQGFSFKAKMATAEKSDRQHFFKMESVVVDVKHLNIKLKQSKHKLLFNLFKPLLFKVLRPVIQKVLEKQIKDSITKADALAYSIYQEAERAAAQAQNDPDSVPNMYNRYFQAAQKKMMQGKEKSKEVAADKKVNVAMTQHDSIFQNIKLPGGISTKATEYKDLARKGDKWESPVFSIGTAKETTSLPKVTPVSRKPHSTAQGGVRGPQNAQSNHTSGFSNQVDQSFGNQQDLSLGQSSGQGLTGTGANGTGLTGTNSATSYDGTSGYQTGNGPTSGYSTGNGPTTTGTSATAGKEHTGTTLGAANPVLTGAGDSS
ncbi:MAG: hypothetical protein M1817_005655 [Caeruleum heppii]|nr:MAG: hypothetical protein M1817_005655 [Caeruleum heppii]